MEFTQHSTPLTRKYACSVCARRKVRCSRTDPCSNCAKTGTECVYADPAPARPRKRLGDEELRARLSECEALLQKHGIEFGGPSHAWVPSGLEHKVARREGGLAAENTPSRSTDAQVEVSPTVVETEERSESLWATLPSELRFPPIRAFSSGSDVASPESADDEIFSGSLFQDLPSEQDLRQLHPQPKHILRLWQIFVDKINPVTKVVHIPTLQQRIWDASFDLDTIQQPLQALMFAVYGLSIATLSSEECVDLLGKTRHVLSKQYQKAALRSLLAADLFVSRDLEVLQALTLLLLIDNDSDLTCTLVGVAIRLGQKMGLDRDRTASDPSTRPDQASPKISFFENEMRIRVFSQIRCIDACTRRHLSIPIPVNLACDFGDMRLPLNINDSELHPAMTDPPLEHTGPTEMLYVLVRYESSHWLHTSPTVAEVFKKLRDPALARQGPDLKDAAIVELRDMLHNKYLRHCDTRIPLHALAVLVTRLTIARMRFKASHPGLGARYAAAAVAALSSSSAAANERQPPSAIASAAAASAGTYSEVCDRVFETGLELLEMGHAVRTHGCFAPPFLGRMVSRPSVEAHIYVVSELRQRGGGERVVDAWRVVERLFEGHPEVAEAVDNPFFLAFGDLVLEAWAVRRAELLKEGMVAEAELMPSFVQWLTAARVQREVDEAALTLGPPVASFNMDGGGEIGWDYWGEIFHLV